MELDDLRSAQEGVIKEWLIRPGGNRLFLWERIFAAYQEDAVKRGRIPADRVTFCSWRGEWQGAVKVVFRGGRRYRVVALMPITERAAGMEWVPPPKERPGPKTAPEGNDRTTAFRELFGVTLAEASGKAGKDPSWTSRMISTRGSSASLAGVAEFAAGNGFDRDALFSFLLED